MFRLKSIKGVLVVGERNIFSELAEIVDIALQVNKIVSNMFSMNYVPGKLAEAMHQVQILEKKSDDIAFKISEDVTGGAISPNVIDSLLEAVQTADDTVDTYYYISRELNRMAKAYASGFERHNANWDSVYQDMIALGVKAHLKLKQLLSSANPAEIMELRKEIESIEEQGDDVKDRGFDRLYGVTPNLSYLEFFHFQELLHKSDDILDSSEDLSDLLVSVVTSILK